MIDEKEVCRSFKQAENQKQQVQILAELNACSKEEILRILMCNGIDVSRTWPRKPKDNDTTINFMYRLLDELDEEIGKREKMYRNAVQSIKEYWKRCEHERR
jgi:RNA processing factor Prp31